MEHIMPAEKQRRRGEAAARQPATPAKRRKVARVAATRTNCSCTARPDVRTYLERSGGEKQVMASLRSLAAGELETELESCERLRDFIRAYGVPRTFKGMREDNVLPLAPVVRHLQHRWAELQSLPHGDDSTAIIREVDALADVCKAAGFARNTSFASKALNVLGVPLPLFSSECLAYLPACRGRRRMRCFRPSRGLRRTRTSTTARPTRPRASASWRRATGRKHR